MKTPGGGSPCFDVREFGAAGDGKSNDTAPIQRAIEACAQSGGGLVRVHNGTFLTGTLVLRSHVELHLTSTARLVGVTDLSLYHRDKKMPYHLINRSLIYAEGCENIAVTGRGTIDGQGDVLRQALERAHGERWWPAAEWSERAVLIRLRDCRNVRIEGVRLTNSGAFAVHPIHCRQMRIEGLRIDNRGMPNNDALDVDGCQDVFISNCNISSGDDSIALKTIEPGLACRDVVITNCILSSDCAAIRVGPDAVADIERVTVSNCVIRDTKLNGIKIQEAFGAVMRDMVFSNIVMDNVSGPISIRVAGWAVSAESPWAVLDDSKWESGQLRNILFENIRARARADYVKSGMFITGTPRTQPRQITFSNIDITFSGGGTAAEAARRDVPDLERTYPEIYIFGVLPAYGLYVHHATGITLNNVQFHLESEDLRPAIVCDDVQDLDLAGFNAEGHPQADSLIRLQNTQRAFITGSRALNPIGTFVRVEGPESRGIGLSGNSLDFARQTVEIAGPLPPDVVSER